MKAIILAAGIGSRIRPLTDNKPKFLLPGKDKILGELMMDNLIKAGIKDFIFVIGHFGEKVKEFVQKKYSKFNLFFVENKIYEKTNTGYSLLLAKKYVQGSDFIKLDGDVYFEFEVLKKIIEEKNENCLTIDTKIHLDKEEVKVIIDRKGYIIEVGKKIDPKKAQGESIGIEKIGEKAGEAFFDELERLMKDEKNYQQYYDDSYTTLVRMGFKFKAVDISGLKWVEVDTFEDYNRFLKLLD